MFVRMLPLSKEITDYCSVINWFDFAFTALSYFQKQHLSYSVNCITHVIN